MQRRGVSTIVRESGGAPRSSSESVCCSTGFRSINPGQIACDHAHPGFLDRLLARLLVLRIPGVLQRIAVAYLATALVARRASSRTIGIITAGLLVGYWLLLTVVPVPGEGVIGIAVLDQPSRTIVAHVDRALFDWSRWGLGNHLWDGALTWDPEGALSTLPSIATALLGCLCGRFMIASRATSASGIVVRGRGGNSRRRGCGASVFPFNKSLWTSSYVLFTAGIGAILLAILSAALDRGSRRAMGAAATRLR